ncbi:hypothetical protein ASF61_05955 [Duganella sp. Leaf126]|uniref:hypothetical protein n=1 Tax=Duganella sp. Leaf126 TaxID=1736266 RepID=UPI0006F6E6EC|nr:hypothetical protein [Duganella sp. Leaf126]KQQ40314.1 hypothetical protein ASF61_05955 [Duganella sp. Leaf126]
MRRAVLLAALWLTWSAAHAQNGLGRLFNTPQERQAIDAARNRPAPAASQTSADAAYPAPPVFAGLAEDVRTPAPGATPLPPDGRAVRHAATPGAMPSATRQGQAPDIVPDLPPNMPPGMEAEMAAMVRAAQQQGTGQQQPAAQAQAPLSAMQQPHMPPSATAAQQQPAALAQAPLSAMQQAQRQPSAAAAQRQPAALALAQQSQASQSNMATDQRQLMPMAQSSQAQPQQPQVSQQQQQQQRPIGQPQPYPQPAQQSPPGAKQLTMNGVLRGSNGRSTVWLNDTPQRGAAVAVGKRDGKAVTVTLPSGKRVLLRPGQRYDLADDRVKDVGQ